MSRIPLLCLIASGVALAGCGSGVVQTPSTCLAPAAKYLAALQPAPAPVRLSGDTRISDCLTRDQSGAALGSVGASVIRAATELNGRARANPSGRDSQRLGYLVGAIQHGAEDTGGIHADLIRRLDAAARFNRGRPMPLSFEHAYGKGYAAGQRSG